MAERKVQRGTLNTLDVISKILGATLLPLALGVGAWWLNGKMEEQKRLEAGNQLYMTLMNEKGESR